jgi:pantetheine-phosphate adenylyltransferase
MKESIIVYPTSSNPPTYGHADLIKRVHKKFDKVYWVNAENMEKKNYFSKKLRLAMMQDYLEHYQWENVILDYTKNSIARYAKGKNAQFLLRGIRNHGDFSFEFELATGNRAIIQDLETLCVLARPEFCTISSSIARELLRLKEDTSAYLLPQVAEKAKKNLKF